MNDNVMNSEKNEEKSSAAQNEKKRIMKMESDLKAN